MWNLYGVVLVVFVITLNVFTLLVVKGIWNEQTRSYNPKPKGKKPPNRPPPPPWPPRKNR